MIDPLTGMQAEITVQLKKILQSQAFRKSGILSAFLTFLVESVMNGQENQIKEYTIGLNVFNKNPGYNTQEDPTVRIHAIRLRKSLHKYYSEEGRYDRIRISIPKGSYVPDFDISQQFHREKGTGVAKPVLAIIPFSYHDQGMAALADGLCDQICTEFSVYSEIAVVAYYSSKKISAQVHDLFEIGRSLGADYLLTGNIQSTDTNFRIRIQLIQNENHLQLWGDSYEGNIKDLNTFAIQDHVMNHVVSQIAGTHGILLRELIKDKQAKQHLDIKVYDAVYWYYYLTGELTEEIYDKACEAMNHAVRINPHYAMGWAVLGEIYVAGYFYGFDCAIAEPLQEALKCGEEALKHDRNCQNAYQTLGLAHLFLKHPNECIKIVNEWMKLRRTSAGIEGGLGFCLICCGDFEKGYKMLSDSIELNPYYPWWFNAGLSIYSFHKKQYENCVFWADKLKGMSPEWENILKTAAYSRDGDQKSALKHFRQVPEMLRMDPKKLNTYLGTFILDESTTKELFLILDGLRDRNDISTY